MSYPRELIVKLWAAIQEVDEDDSDYEELYEKASDLSVQAELLLVAIGEDPRSWTDEQARKDFEQQVAVERSKALGTEYKVWIACVGHEEGETEDRAWAEQITFLDARKINPDYSIAWPFSIPGGCTWKTKEAAELESNIYLKSLKK